VVLTSNRTREIGDALRRRCLYLYVEHPTPKKEVAILEARVPGASRRLAEEIARFMASLRERRLSRAPGVAETLDWARALLALHRDHLDLETVEHTLGCVLKDPHDVREIRDLGRGELEALLAAAREPMAAAP
jgi:MoxR-like ATPase